MNKQSKVTEAPELMNTKQAAQFLNVSEISIRRWTQTGKLPCVRVGARRERRFDKEQLMEFLRNQNHSPISEKHDISHTKNESFQASSNCFAVQIEGMTISPGEHLCTLYETDTGITKLSVPFLAQGLKNNDLCVLVASEFHQKIIIDALSKIYTDIKVSINNGSLILFDGIPHSFELYQYFENTFLSATRNGYSSIRVVGDMGWAISKKMAFDDLMTFERDYNHNLCPSFPVVSLCQYDARNFTGTEILQALNNHKDTFKHTFSRFIGH